MKPSNTTTSGKATDIIAGIPGMYTPSFALPMYKTTGHGIPYLYRSVQYRYLSTVCVQLASLINMVVDVVVQNPQKSNEYDYEKKTCTS